LKYTSDQYEHFWTSELGKVVRAGRDRLRAACPVHEGDSPYTLSINLVTGYAHCFKCHGDGEGWSMIDFTIARHGYDQETASEYVRNLVGGTNGNRSGIVHWDFPFPKPLAITNARVELSHLAERITSYAEYLDQTETPAEPGWHAYALYIYETIKAVKVRFQYKDTGAKRLCWLALTPRGGWSNLKKLGLEAPPYRAATLKGAGEVWLLNGEKACDRAIETWGVVATCLPNGEDKWKKEYLSWFTGIAAVYLVMDNDTTGVHHGKTIGARLVQGGVPTRLVRLDGVPPKGDLYDYIELGGTLEACREIARSSPLADSIELLEKPARKKPGPVPLGTANGSEPDLLPYEYTDNGNAQRLAHYRGNILRYARELETPWQYFTKTHWRSGTVEVGYQSACDTMDLLQRQGNRLKGEQSERIWKFANNKKNAGGIHAMLDLARGILPVDPAEFDRHPLLVNCANGTLDLESGKLRAHSADDYLTRTFPFVYNPELGAPEIFLRSLEQWFGGGPEAGTEELERAQEMIAYLRRLFGYWITGDTHHKSFFILHGSGNNGKTTFLAVVLGILGPYAVTISPNTLTTGWGRNENNVNADIARMRGMRVAVTAEPSDKKFDQGLVKKLTQGDVPVTGVFKGRQPFDFFPSAKLILETNNIPTFDVSDKPFIDRMHLIHFCRTFPLSIGKSQRELIWPELPQIFNWAITGAIEVVKDGLGTPLAIAREQMAAARDRQARENDTLEPFLEEYFNQAPELTCTMAEIEAIYRPWCDRSRLRPLPRNLLSRQLCEREGIVRGSDPRNHKEAAWLKGLGLKTGPSKVPQYKEPTDD
jgi:P4 family phage/plasmid primase-like protien